ncbi:hypothetical protein [Phreatobacter sp.]|uniref:hypothetical protein n=1 Tax=Phreatobacter sp. TaxID=1966341 RepID=UPI0025F97F0E|nr:hypothetical protein [Phreatobacter sp.]
MPPVLMGAAVAVVMVATYVLVRRSLQAQLKPVRAQKPGHRLRRDPATGEYRPF